MDPDESALAQIELPHFEAGGRCRCRQAVVQRVQLHRLSRGNVGRRGVSRLIAGQADAVSFVPDRNGSNDAERRDQRV
jgi:hypothetical protein